MAQKSVNLTSWQSIFREIDLFIEEYNFTIPHMGLEKGADGFNKRPADVYLDETLRQEVFIQQQYSSTEGQECHWQISCAYATQKSLQWRILLIYSHYSIK